MSPRRSAIGSDARRPLGAAPRLALGAVVGVAALLSGSGSAIAATVRASAAPLTATPPTATPGGAAATTVPAGGSITADRAEAAQLAAQIQSEGQRLEQLAEQADGARIRALQLHVELARAEQRSRQIGRDLRASRTQLRSMAVAAYVDGDSLPVDAQVSGVAGADPSLTSTYANLLAGEQRETIVEFGHLLAEQAVEARQLAATVSQADQSVNQLSADQTSAQAASVAEQRTLDGITGQLKVLVAQAEQAQAAAQAEQVQQNLAQQGALPPDSPQPPDTAVTAPPRPATTTTLRTVPPTTATSVAPGTSAPPTTSSPSTTPTTTPSGGNTPATGWATAVAYARAQLGKPYQWGGAGPDSFDCSGLVMEAWAAAGVQFPHLAQDQYDMTERIPLGDLLPGDLVFFGTPDDVYHVGIYVGNGDMIDAPATGQDVQVDTIYWSNLLGAGRVITS